MTWILLNDAAIEQSFWDLFGIIVVSRIKRIASSRTRCIWVSEFRYELPFWCNGRCKICKVYSFGFEWHINEWS